LPYKGDEYDDRGDREDGKGRIAWMKMKRGCRKSRAEQIHVWAIRDDR
jgi:hypothetical protein